MEIQRKGGKKSENNEAGKKSQLSIKQLKTGLVSGVFAGMKNSKNKTEFGAKSLLLKNIILDEILPHVRRQQNSPMYKVLENVLPMNSWKKLLENLQHSMSYEIKQWAKV